MKLFKFLRTDYNYMPFLLLFVVPILFRFNKNFSTVIIIVASIAYLTYWFFVTSVYLDFFENRKQAIYASMRDHIVLLIAIAANYIYDILFIPDDYAEVNFMLMLITALCLIPKCLTYVKMHKNGK